MTIVNGTTYHKDTPKEVIDVLEAARISGRRIRLHFGDQDTGRDWMEECDTEGYIGRSCGKTQVPILLHNRRSIGGGSILDHCIVKITTRTDDGRGRVLLYKHPMYWKPTLCLRIARPCEYRYRVYADETNVANFKTGEKARRWIKKMEDV